MPIATAIAIGGLALSAASTAGSFIQAGKQRQMQIDAETAAATAMAEANKKLDVNYYKGLAVGKEKYTLEREALVSAGAQAVQAGQESDRGAAVTAGRIQMAQQEGEAGIRTAMGTEKQGLDLMVAKEDARLRDVKAQLNLEEAAGAQLAAANASDAQQKALQQGLQGLTNMAEYGSQFVPLYEKSASGRITGKLEQHYADLQKKGTIPADMSFQKALETYGGNSFAGVGDMTEGAFKDYMASLPPSVLRGLDLSKLNQANMVGPTMDNALSAVSAPTAETDPYTNIWGAGAGFGNPFLPPQPFTKY